MTERIELSEEEKHKFAAWLEQSAGDLTSSPFENSERSINEGAMRWKLRETASFVAGTHPLLHSASKAEELARKLAKQFYDNQQFEGQK